MGQGFSSIVKCLPRTHKALSLTPSTEEGREEKREEGREERRREEKRERDGGGGEREKGHE